MNKYKEIILIIIKRYTQANKKLINRFQRLLEAEDNTPELLEDMIDNLANSIEIDYNIVLKDKRTENQIWKDIYKKHFKNIKSPRNFNNKIASLLKTEYLRLKYDISPTSKLCFKIKYIFNPQIRKDSKSYYDNTIKIYHSNTPVFNHKWVLSDEEFELYPIVYENFVLHDLHDETIFRSLFKRAKYKKEVIDYLKSLPEDTEIDIQLQKYNIHIGIKNKDIPNSDLSDLFSFIKDVVYEDLRNEEVLLNNKKFHI